MSEIQISVLMGVYNCASTIEAAVKSIQNQTIQDWELIICDDGSKDDTFSIVKDMSEKDQRIVLIKNKKNLGLNQTLNNCLSIARGKYIARMDGDDLCDPLRFEKELAYLENHPEFQIVSTTMKFFDDNGFWGVSSCIENPTSEDVVEKSPICHAPVMLLKECMIRVGGYTIDKRTTRVEDVDLWIKLYAYGYRCHNLDEPLYCMRNDENAFKRRKYRYRINSTYVRLLGCKKLKLGIKSYILSFSPMIIGLVPTAMRKQLRLMINKNI